MKIRFQPWIKIVFSVMLTVANFVDFENAMADVVELGFTSLPSAQGWVYSSANNSATEYQVFSLNDGILHQDSTIRSPQFSGADDNVYFYAGTNLSDGPFNIRIEARVTAYAFDVSQAGFATTNINPFGFGFGFFGPKGLAYVAITTNLVVLDKIDSDGHKVDFYTILYTNDNTAFHVYELNGVMATNGSFSVFRDGVFLGSSPLRTDVTASYVNSELRMGDFSGGAVATADVVSFSYQSIVPIIHISKAVRLDYTNLIAGVNYQLQSSGDLVDWTNSGNAFRAISSSDSIYQDVTSWNTFWRLMVVP